jgi:hypothetical protein
MGLSFLDIVYKATMHPYLLNFVFLIFPIYTTFPSAIIKKWLNPKLTCGTSIRADHTIIHDGYIRCLVPVMAWD